MAVGVLGMLTLSGTTLIYYSNTNARSAEFSARGGSAYNLAEAGIDEVMAILSKPENNALNPYLLGKQADGSVTTTTHSYGGGTVSWSGTLDTTAALWSVTSTGTVRNSTAAAAIKRTVKAEIPVTPTFTQPLNNPAWNYIYAFRTGNACDMTVQQSVQVGSPLYVAGNLCLQNSAWISRGPLVVNGRLTMSQSGNSVGTSSAPVSEAHIGAGCQWKNNPLSNPCRGVADNVFASVLTNRPPQVVAPAVYWDDWYRNASPGPYYPCTTSSGIVPVFDNDQGSPAAPDPTRRNNSLATVLNLTPSSSYTCRTAGGEISWNASTRVLTVAGTIFVDGSAQIQNGSVNSYNGQASLYLSGTLLIKNSKVCAVLATGGSACGSASSWNPNQRLLVVVANGNGGQVSSGDSIQLVSSHFQGAFYGTNAIDIDTTSIADGPLVGSTVMLGQSTSTSFPSITTVPAGMPSNPTVYAQPNPPRIYG